jgi:hypothetical protein
MQSWGWGLIIGVPVVVAGIGYAISKFMGSNSEQQNSDGRSYSYSGDWDINPETGLATSRMGGKRHTKKLKTHHKKTNRRR